MKGCELTFPVVRGVQAGREYYVAMCPLGALARVFVPDESAAEAVDRAQRVLNRGRVPRLARFLARNPEDYTFAPITACVDGDVTFDPVGSEEAWQFGRLIVSLTADLLVTDGQHRWRAIRQALEMEPSLADETIPVVFYVDQGLERRQQMFADLNMHAVRPTRSLGILYEHRDPVAELARNVAEGAPIFRGRTEVEKTTISNRSSNLFTLSAIYQATAGLLGKREGDSVDAEDEDLAIRFWSCMGELLPGWSDLLRGEMRPWELRSQYVHGHGVVLQALGAAGYDLIEEDVEWEERLRKSNLPTMDWSRSNVAIWEGRALSNGRISKALKHVQLTTSLVKQKLELPLSKTERELEDELKMIRDELGSEAA